jgi:hypothetical protein
LLEDGDIGISVFPKGQEFTVGGAGFDCVSLHRVGATELEMRQCAYRVAEQDPTVIENFLELDSGFLTLLCGQIGLATHVGREEAARSQFIPNCDLQQFDSL